MTVFALLSGRDLSAAVRFFLAIYPLILSAALILVLATPVTIIRLISCAAAKSRVLPVTTLLLVAGAFLESLVSAEAILRECLVAGRVRRGGAQISVYGAALRQALLLLNEGSAHCYKVGIRSHATGHLRPTDRVADILPIEQDRAPLVLGQQRNLDVGQQAGQFGGICRSHAAAHGRQRQGRRTVSCFS